MLHGMLYDCPRSLVESWWIRLEERGFSIELETAPTVEVLPDRDSVRYRDGLIRHEGAIVDISASPGAYSPRSPLYGKHLLFITFRKSSRVDAELAQTVGDLLVEFGASEVTPEYK